MSFILTRSFSSPFLCIACFTSISQVHFGLHFVLQFAGARWDTFFGHTFQAFFEHFRTFQAFTSMVSIMPLPIPISFRTSAFLTLSNLAFVPRNPFPSFLYVPISLTNYPLVASIAVSYTHLDVYKRQI